MNDFGGKIGELTYSWKIRAPEGKMLIHITEDVDGKPILMMINIGKAGAPVMAWADALARLVTKLFPLMGLQDIIAELSGITADGAPADREDNIKIRSGPEAVAVTLMRFSDLQYERNAPTKRSDACISRQVLD